MKINNIELSLYDSSNEAHNKLLKEFESTSKSNYIHSIKERLVNFNTMKTFPFETSFFVAINNKIIGYLFISKCVNDEVYLENSILKEYRGMGYGKIILNDISNYLIDNYNIKSIVLDISPSNIASIKTALSCGYTMDEEEYLDRNMSGKILYRLDNYNYVSKRRK